MKVCLHSNETEGYWGYRYLSFQLFQNKRYQYTMVLVSYEVLRNCTLSQNIAEKYRVYSCDADLRLNAKVDC